MDHSNCEEFPVQVRTEWWSALSSGHLLCLTPPHSQLHLNRYFLLHLHLLLLHLHSSNPFLLGLPSHTRLYFQGVLAIDLLHISIYLSILFDVAVVLCCSLLSSPPHLSSLAPNPNTRALSLSLVDSHIRISHRFICFRTGYTPTTR